MGNDEIGKDLFSRSMRAIAMARELGPAIDGPHDQKLKVDYQVADQLLPIFSNKPSSIMDIRADLAASLSYARVWAEHHYPSIVVQIEFEPTSIALIRLESAYKGLTNRWRISPGSRERQLQRMEGNPLFLQGNRSPSDQEIEDARLADEAEALRLQANVDALFEELKAMDGDEKVSSGLLIDLAQHRLEPLMVKAAELGALPQALDQLTALKRVGESILKSLHVTGADLAVHMQSWEELTNSFRAQASRNDRQIPTSDYVAALLCESTEEITEVLAFFKEKDADVCSIMGAQAVDLFTLAEMENFQLPDTAGKVALFSRFIRGEKSESVEPRPWWNPWRSQSGNSSR